MRLTFAQVSGFVAQWRALKLTDADLSALEVMIMEHPDAGDVIRGTGGVRKLRFAPPSWKRGKSGSARVCYVVLVESEFCYLLALYAKNQKADLGAGERNEMKRLIEALRKAHRGN